MTTIGYSFRLSAGFVAAAVLGFAASGPIRAENEARPVVLVPHRAVYDLKLADARGKRALEAVRGRIVYDFAGTVCEGYALQFRQVTELDTGEGKVALSDLRSTTWEDGAGKSFRFNSQNFLNRQLVESVDGKADRSDSGVMATLAKPMEKKIDVGNVVFPSEHMRRIVVAARAGQSLLELAVYDGSDNGEKIYNSLTVIGRKIAPDGRKPGEAAASNPILAGLDRWPVTISYFDKTKQGGEQTPIYAISFEVYDNGIARALVLDYGDFSVSGELSSLDSKEAAACP